MTATVTQEEANLLTLARMAVGLIPPADVMRLLVTSVPAPAKLGPTARRLLGDTLSRGVVLAMARHGGWYPDPAAPTTGRLWDRASPPSLAFTGTTVQLLQWLLTTPLSELETTALATKAPLTLAESVLVTLLLDVLRGTGCEGALARQPVVRRSPLVALAHVAELARVAAFEEDVRFDLATLATPIEALRGVLTRSWVAGERVKRELEVPAVLSRIGHAQAAVLEAFLDAVDAAGRRGLATFLIDAGVTYFPRAEPARAAEDVAGALSANASLRERTEARRSAAAFARAFARLRAWDQEHRVVRFIDDGYDVAQALVRDWERLGERGFTAADSLAQALDAI